MKDLVSYNDTKQWQIEVLFKHDQVARCGEGSRVVGAGGDWDAASVYRISCTKSMHLRYPLYRTDIS